MSVKKLIDKYDSEELVNSFILPVKLNRKQQKEAAEQLSAARKKLRNQASEQDVLTLNLMQLKYQLEDYVKNDQYDPDKKFGYFLKAYLDIINKKAGELAKDVNVHKTLISQYISNSRKPNDTFLIRLELHSNNNIPAHYWFMVIQKDIVYRLQMNKSLRKQEKPNVTNKLRVKI